MVIKKTSMKSVKIPDLSQAELNVPFVHFHREEAENSKKCYVELFINAPLGTECSKKTISHDDDSKTIYVTFYLDHPKHIQEDAFELIHIKRVQVDNVFNSDEAVISVNVHVNIAPHHLGPEADGTVTVRYKDIKL